MCVKTTIRHLFQTVNNNRVNNKKNRAVKAAFFHNSRCFKGSFQPKYNLLHRNTVSCGHKSDSRRKNKSTVIVLLIFLLITVRKNQKQQKLHLPVCSTTPYLMKEDSCASPHKKALFFIQFKPEWQRSRCWPPSLGLCFALTQKLQHTETPTAATIPLTVTSQMVLFHNRLSLTPMQCTLPCTTTDS